MTKIKRHLPLIFFLFSYIGMIGYKLIFHAVPFYDWDESLYVQTGKEMFAKNYFWFPVWQGKPWLDKPPFVPFVYGLIVKLFQPVPAEISARIFTLLITIVVLIFVYILYLKTVKEPFLATAITALTAFTPIFVQRAQVANLDVFLLLGWLGFFIFYNNLWIGLLFAMISVFSKSLIGLYPIFIITGYQLLLFCLKKISNKQLIKILKKLAIQLLVTVSWFVLMFFLFGKTFWVQHIVESHFHRVTSSIEFHFGQRTYYFDLAADQFKLFIWTAALGMAVIIYQLIKNKKIDLLPALFLLPWFIFLNLTKTKIFWYFYSAIPQFAFLSLYLISYLRQKKTIYYLLIIIVFFSIFYTAIKTNNLFTTYYSKNNDAHYLMSLYAKDRCNMLYIILNPETRKSFATLDKMGLLITTTKWWGNHPSIVYYFEKKVVFSYEEEKEASLAKKLAFHDCLVIDQSEPALNLKPSEFSHLNNFQELSLYLRN